MGTADAGRFDTAPDAPGTDRALGRQLVPAAAALRWQRPDLTATLAELALDAATDARTWVGAAGWLLHGRSVLGDGRETAAELLDGLGRWGAAGTELMGGPAGRRLRVELAGPARRIGEPGVARALLAAEPGLDDTELCADVLTELARCAIDETPDAAEEALRAAARAWEDLACPAGVAAVRLLSAAWHRQAGRVDDAIAQATDGLRRVHGGGRRAGATACDHVAAALTAEWIAALVEAGRLDEARDDAVPAARRLIAVARTGRQTAGLRLALARITAVAESPEDVVAALDAAAQDAADSDVPELESACRSMLGELHETAGRLDVALGALRTAMTAERRDRERGTRLHARLTAAAGEWACRPSRPARDTSPTAPPGATVGRRDDPLGSWAVPDLLGGVPAATAPASPSARPELLVAPADTGDSVLRNGVPAPHDAIHHATHHGGDRRNGAGVHDRSGDRPVTGRRARRRAAEAGSGDEAVAVPRDAGPLPDPSGTSRFDAHDRDVASSTRWTGLHGGSLIGDALLRELGHGSGGADPVPPAGHRSGPARHADRPAEPRDRSVPADDPLFGPSPVSGGRGAANPPSDRSASDRDTPDPGTPDDRTTRRDSTRPPADPPPSRDAANDAVDDATDDAMNDTVVLDPGSGRAQPADPAADRPPAAGQGQHGPAARSAGRRSPADPDGLGLADLLAGALAAYRNL